MDRRKVSSSSTASTDCVVGASELLCPGGRRRTGAGGDGGGEGEVEGGCLLLIFISAATTTTRRARALRARRCVAPESRRRAGSVVQVYAHEICFCNDFSKMPIISTDVSSTKQVACLLPGVSCLFFLAPLYPLWGGSTPAHCPGVCRTTLTVECGVDRKNTCAYGMRMHARRPLV